MGHSEYDPAAKEQRPRTPARRPGDVRSRNRQQAARILVTLSPVAEFSHARSSSSRRQVGRFNSSSSNPPAAAILAWLERRGASLPASRRERCADMASVVAGALNRALKSPCLV